MGCLDFDPCATLADVRIISISSFPLTQVLPLPIPTLLYSTATTLLLPIYLLIPPAFPSLLSSYLEPPPPPPPLPRHALMLSNSGAGADFDLTIRQQPDRGRLAGGKEKGMPVLVSLYPQATVH